MGATWIVAPFLIFNHKMQEEEKNKELRPSKMRGVAFPKSKYGVILAIVIFIVVNLIYYRETIFSFFR